MNLRNVWEGGLMGLRPGGTGTTTSLSLCRFGQLGGG